jgi:hypothetical protein
MNLNAAHDSDSLSRQQAAQLMQPAFIRVIDHLRTTLEQSKWVGQYETIQAWPAETTPEMQAEVLYLMDQIEAVEDGDRAALEDRLEALPQPISVYLLHLAKAEQRKTLNLWELCYQICLLDYVPQIERTTVVEIPLGQISPDYTLFDDNGEVDWTRLDLKAAQAVQAAFQSLERAEF